MKAQVAQAPKVEVKKAEQRVPSWVMPAVKSGVFAVDAVLAAAALMLAFWLREGGPLISTDTWEWSAEFKPYAGILYFAVLVRLAMLIYERFYRFEGAFSYTRETIKVFKAVSVGSLLIIGWAFLFRGGFEFRLFSYSRSIFILEFFLALGLFTTFHLGLRAAQSRVRRRDVNLIPTLVVGTNGEAVQTIRELNERPQLGYRVIGIVESTGHAVSHGSKYPAPLLGDLGELPELIRDFEIQEVIITDSSIPSELLFDAMMQIGRKQRVEFRFAPRLLDVLPKKTSVEQLGVLPMVRLFREPLSDAERFLKRASDVLIASAAMVLVSPIWLLISLLIKFDTPGQSVFRQERVGMDGRIFLCYKFRTMHRDSDESLHREAYQRNIEGMSNANAGDKDEPLFGKVKDDPRVTVIGRFLRRSSLDELPQLLNVLKGDMSIVGPRPPIPYEVEEYELWHRKRLDMKPGITGLWQVSGRNRLTFKEMVRIDLYYIENWSLWLDLKIILLTLPAVVRGDGAR